MNKSVIAGVVVIIALLVAGYFSGYLGFLGGERTLTIVPISRSPDAEEFVVSPPISLDYVRSTFVGTVEAEPGVFAEAAYFTTLDRPSEIKAPSPGIATISPHFSGGTVIAIDSDNYTTFILMNNPELLISNGDYIGAAIPIANVKEKIPNTDSEIIIYALNKTNWSYVNLYYYQRLPIHGNQTIENRDNLTTS